MNETTKALKTEMILSLLKEPLFEAFTSVPIYGSVSIQVVFHQGEIVRTEITRSISRKISE